MSAGEQLMEPGSPQGTPLTQDSPAPPARSRPLLMEPLCSPIAQDGSPLVMESPGGRMVGPSPSPASKRFVGVSNNARNDLYMKTLINSPYHKSYTPLSATPGFSPVYHTPLRVTHPDDHTSSHHPTYLSKSPHPTWTSRSPHPTKPGVSPYRSQQPSVTSTPQGTRPPGSGHRIVTPKGHVIVNPFDNGVDDLHLPAYMSPGFFTCASTPATEEKRMFRWSIEQQAELFPADIDETAVKHHSHGVRFDRETEERAQRAIEQFFANNLIAPSPMTDPQKQRKKPVIPVTPNNHGPGEEMMAELQGSIQRSLPSKQGTTDASCQTMLSLPVDFDLAKVLGAYMSGETEEGNQADMLSTSSLRRKLFFHGDTSSLAPSPVKGVSRDVEMAPGSPLFRTQSQPNFDHTTPLKNTPAFSSSPIKSNGTPQYRRRSSDPEFLASPELSPIVKGNLQKSKTKSRSSGMFEPHPPDFDVMSPIGNFDHIDALESHSPVSPIPFDTGESPDTGAVGTEDLRPKFEDSPGFSPIRPQKVAIRKILRKSQEESYIQEEAFDSDEDAESMTPVSTNHHTDNSAHTPGERTSLIGQSPIQRLSTTLAKSHSFSTVQHKTMDTDASVHERDHILTSSLCDTRDFTSQDFQTSGSFHDDTNQQNSQDTGYQTASLQSTNAESISLHTNLTTQFGSMPFNVTNQDSLFHTSSLMPANEVKAPVLSIQRHFSSIASPNTSACEEEIITSSNNALSSPISLFPKQKLLFMDEDEEDSDEHLVSQDPSKYVIPAKLNFEDSALPDENMSDHKHMEVDRARLSDSDSDCVMTQEKQVLSRARQALAMANSRYPLDEGKGLSLQLGVSEVCGNDGGSTLESEDGGTRQYSQSASELAMSIIQRAGKDLARYGNVTAGGKRTQELTMEGLHHHS